MCSFLQLRVSENLRKMLRCWQCCPKNNVYMVAPTIIFKKETKSGMVRAIVLISPVPVVFAQIEKLLKLDVQK